MNRIILIVLLIALGIYFNLFSAEQVLTFAGKVIDGTVHIVKSIVAFFDSGEASKIAKDVVEVVNNGVEGVKNAKLGN